MGKISIEDKKVEAIKRMKSIRMYGGVIKQFKDEDLINQSEPPMGACYWISPETAARVKEFEENNDALVYHVIKSYTSIGIMESYLFVSDYKEEWLMEREDLKYGRSIAYVYNEDAPWCSDIGTIGIALTMAGGLKRTA